MKRTIALILAIVLCLSLSPAAQASPAVRTKSFTVTQTVTNPLYPEFRDETEPAVITEHEPGIRPTAGGETYLPLDKALAKLASYLEKRQEHFYIYVKHDEYIEAMALFDAFKHWDSSHTGVPTQGDYLLWAYKSYRQNTHVEFVETGSGDYWTAKIELTMKYYHNADQEKVLTKKIGEVMKALKVASIPDDYHKVRAIYDYICDHVVYSRLYDESDPNYLLQYSAYGAMVNGSAVCQGISTLFYRMLLEAGIDNRVITGWVWTGAHAWNIVKIGDCYYNTDATNDLGREEEYRYFLRSEEFFKSHTRDDYYDTLKFKLYYPVAKEDYDPVHRFDGQPWVIVKKATCTEDGLKTQTCAYCDESHSLAIPATGHYFEWQHSTEATCEEGGIITEMCLNCGFVTTYSGEVPKGHDYDLYILKEPTVDEEGLIREVCIRCGHTQETSVFKHEHILSIIDSTWDCCNRGYDRFRCYVSNCPVQTRYNYTDPVGHEWNYGSFCRVCQSDRTMPFSDVDPRDFFYYPVFWALDLNITSGTSPRRFSPNNPCQRAQVVTFLWRAAGQPEPTGKANPFVDVKETDFYYDAVLWAVEKGITNGLDQTHFGPFEACNRAQVVTFLHRAFGKPAPSTTTHPFTDANSSAFYYSAMLWAVENGITNGLSATTFGPDAICNRAQIVTFLNRAYMK